MVTTTGVVDILFLQLKNYRKGSFLINSFNGLSKEASLQINGGKS